MQDRCWPRIHHVYGLGSSRSIRGPARCMQAMAMCASAFKWTNGKHTGHNHLQFHLNASWFLYFVAGSKIVHGNIIYLAGRRWCRSNNVFFSPSFCHRRTSIELSRPLIHHHFSVSTWLAFVFILFRLRLVNGVRSSVLRHSKWHVPAVPHVFFSLFTSSRLFTITTK